MKARLATLSFLSAFNLSCPTDLPVVDSPPIEVTKINNHSKKPNSPRQYVKEVESDEEDYRVLFERFLIALALNSMNDDLSSEYENHWMSECVEDLPFFQQCELLNAAVDHGILTNRDMDDLDPNPCDEFNDHISEIEDTGYLYPPQRVQAHTHHNRPGSPTVNKRPSFDELTRVAMGLCPAFLESSFDEKNTGVYARYMEDTGAGDTGGEDTGFVNIGWDY